MPASIQYTAAAKNPAANISNPSRIVETIRQTNAMIKDAIPEISRLFIACGVSRENTPRISDFEVLLYAAVIDDVILVPIAILYLTLANTLILVTIYRIHHVSTTNVDSNMAPVR